MKKILFISLLTLSQISYALPSQLVGEEPTEHPGFKYCLYKNVATIVKIRFLSHVPCPYYLDL